MRVLFVRVLLFAILQKYDFSSKSQPRCPMCTSQRSCLRYCKSTIFQANHNTYQQMARTGGVVCDTAKVRFFKQITTLYHTGTLGPSLFAILQKYDFSSKSQPSTTTICMKLCCLRYCKSTIFQANHNDNLEQGQTKVVVCDTAKVRFFKQITTPTAVRVRSTCCLRYCKSTIFQANHNNLEFSINVSSVVCDTAKVRFFKQITTNILRNFVIKCCLRYCKSTIFQANHNNLEFSINVSSVVCDTAKVRFFKQITTLYSIDQDENLLFAILQKYDFSSKSQRYYHPLYLCLCCLRYCKSTIFQANHNGGFP